MKINKKLLPMKGHYFLLYCGLSPIAPFLPVIAKDLGFSALVVGTIFTVVPLLSFPIKPLLGGIADKYQCQKLMFLLLLVVQTLFYLSIYWIPPLPRGSSSLTCDDSVQFKICRENLQIEDLPSQSICKIDCLYSANKSVFEIEITRNDSYKKDDCILLPVIEVDTALCNITSSCKTTCEDTFINNIITSSISDEDVIKYYQFWLLLFLIATAKTASAAMTSIGDTICFNLLGDKPTDFGLQRLWGAAGWGSMSLLSGLIVDKMSEGSESKIYTTAYYFLIIFCILDVIVSSTLDFKVISNPPKSIIKDVYKVIKNRHIAVFMLWCFVNGIYTAMIWNFLFWFLEEVATNNGYGDMTYIKTLEGLTLTFHCYFGEIPFFFISSWLIKKIGHANSMTLVLGAFAVRFIVYSYLTNPWWTLPAEMLNGITFGIFYATMTTYACTFSPPGTETTVQNLVAALYDALGVSLGSFIGGYMIQNVGGVWTFWYMGLSAAFLTVLHAVCQFFMKKPDYISGSRSPDKKEIEYRYSEEPQVLSTS